MSKEKINGKCFNLIYNMYQNIKSKIITSEGSSAFFECHAGVRQGENLSPFLFSIFLNDLHEYLGNKEVNGIQVQGEAEIFLKLYILLYADDTVIFSDNAHDLQNALEFDEYCNRWKLTINVSKT